MPEQYRAKDHVVWRSKKELLVVMDTVTGHYFTLNPVAVELWNGLIDQARPLSEVMPLIKDKFEDPPPDEKLTQDCRAMIQEWLGENLIEPTQTPQPDQE